MICGPLTGHCEAVTTDATPQGVELFRGNPDSGIVIGLKILCRRPSDNVMKAWDISAVIAVDSAGVATLKALRDNAAFGLAADLTALAAAGIGFFSSGSIIGVTFTGIVAQSLNWCADAIGIQIID